MHETQHDILHPFFHPNPEGNVQPQYMDCDSIVFSVKTHDFIGDLAKLQKKRYFQQPSEEASIIPSQNWKVKTETPGSLTIKKIIALRSEAYSNTRNWKKKAELWIIKEEQKVKSFTENIRQTEKTQGGSKLSHQKSCDENRDNHVIGNQNHELCLQKGKKLAFNVFDDKKILRKLLSKIESEVGVRGT